MNSINQKKSKKRFVVIAAGIALLLTIGAGVYIFSLGGFSSTTSRTDPARDGSSPEDNVQNSDVSEDDKKTTDTTESSKNEADKNTPDSSTVVDVTIVDAAQYEGTVEARAYATDVADIATCNFTFTKGTATLSRETKASNNAQTSSCATLSVPASDFPSKGTWNLIVKYSAGAKNGTSDTRMVEVK